VTEMVRRFLRQKLGSPAILIVMAAFALLSMIPLVASKGKADTGAGLIVLFVLAAGAVSRDASSGALQMILARPIRRSEYLFGRFLGIAAAFGLFLLVTFVLAILMPKILPFLTSADVDAGAIARALAGSFLSGLLVAAMLVFFSTFLPGYADVLALFLSGLLLNVPGVLAGWLKAPWLSRFGTVLNENLSPTVPWDEVLRGDNVLREATGRYALALVAILAAALVVFSRREFAYGQD
jgi:ABC-type transport system involved in multi-copper enzyme maturation permease subunit